MFPITGTKPLFIDGALGTMLQNLGLPPGQPPETLNLDAPEKVLSVHEGYLESGCNILTANTFGANPFAFPDSWEAVASAGVALARKAAKARGALVAMSMGPMGRLLVPMGPLPFEEAVALFGSMAKVGEAQGADCILLETMTDSYELKAAILGAKEYTNLPVMATLAVDREGKLLTGGDIPGMVAMMEGLRVNALGLNCGFGPDIMLPLIRQVTAYSSLPVICSPNAGLPEIRAGRAVYSLAPETFAEQMEAVLLAGAAILGGCCGTTPNHIASLVNRLSSMEMQPITKKDHTLVSSHGRTVFFGDMPVMIGERINPTGKKRLGQALLEEDMDYVLEEAARQEENGAEVLDINAGMPGVDEGALLPRLVAAVQEVTTLPLQIDTGNAKAMEAALRLYNGKALVNSVSGKAQDMARVFPLVQKYGGVVVALPLDEEGIPATAQGRIDIAGRILAEAEKYGIAKKDILLDGLVMAVSAQEGAALVTLETVKRAKTELGLYTVLGISNVSFGLPGRGTLNAAFISMALAAGLDGAILNPLSRPITDAWYAAAALTGRDGQFARYLEKAEAFSPQSGEKTPKVAEKNDLRQAIYKGLKKEAAARAEELLAQGEKPMEIIEGHIMPALDQVGKGFEGKTLFLPQLLMSAGAAKEAFSLLREGMAASGQTQKVLGRVLIATVEGDVHDIGKNIVKVLLENYGFAVTDLGRDVKAEAIVEKVRLEDFELVGLSALMTTTLPAMERTIALLREACPHCKVMVGGAVLTEEYARKMGADFYGKDAMASVQYARTLFGGEGR